MIRKTSVTYCIGRDKQMPMVRLRGQWLAAAGFAPGTTVAVAVHRGRLVLEIAGANERAALACEPEAAYSATETGGER